MATYLVTGGCGFIGSHCVERLLADGHQVRVLDNLSTGKIENIPVDKVELMIGDITVQQDITAALAGVDGCFHLAAIVSVQQSIENWVGTHLANLTGTIRVFDGARTAKQGHPIPVVYASSAAVYGDNNQLPLSETASTQPLSAYGADKLACEFHAQVASRAFCVPTFGLRFFNVYGPRQDPHSPYSGVISIFYDHIRQSQSITIYGDGKQTRDFVYVGDVVNHLMRAMAAADLEGHVTNVCTGRETRVETLATLLGELFKEPVTIDYQPRKIGDIYQSLGNPKHANSVLGCQADITLREGLQKMVSDTFQHQH